jgi:excinuclease UvrABC nuclease subunit
MAKNISLVFSGYWRDSRKDELPKESGIYLVYAGTPKPNNIVDLRQLLYIGESSNVHDRIAEHDRYEDWKKSLKKGELLYYVVAPASKEERTLAEAALIFRYKPPYNEEYVDNYPFQPVKLTLSGLDKEKNLPPFLYKDNKGVTHYMEPSLLIESSTKVTA